MLDLLPPQGGESRSDPLETAVHLLSLQQERAQAGHARRTMEHAVRLALAVGLAPHEVRWVRWGALLHDIGKVRVPRAILHKPGRLDPPEYDLVLQHPEWGVELLAPLPWLPRPTLDAVRHHHERWDGQGYPHGLHGPDIPLSARIVALADTFDALTSARPYKPGWSVADAALYLLGEAGRRFDPDLTPPFVEGALGAAAQVSGSVSH